MDCDSKRSKPLSTRPLLYQQVQEQASLCDVTIKVGLWEKRFHWCVLVASPFFENIQRNNFLEKQTGIVEFTKWTASIVETAVVFLYGQKPKIKDSNVDMLLDMAEFLMIPELKVACIEFLKRTTVTIEKCMQLLELSSVYDIVLDKCESFIKGRLPEMLEQERMLNATTESVEMLLTDATLRYVPVQSWFNFLIRWVQKSATRQTAFVKLFNMLDFSECDQEFLTNIVAKEPLVINAKEQVEKTLTTGQSDAPDTVLIFKKENYDETLTCLNMRTMLWYRLNMNINNDDEKMRPFRSLSIVSSVKDSNSSCIYKVSNDYRSLDILTHDLSSTESSVSKVMISSNNEGEEEANKPAGSRDIDHYSLANDILAAVSNRTISTATADRDEDEERDMYFDSIDSYLMQRALLGGGNRRSTKTSTLYLGEVHEPVTELRPVFTIKNHSISDICRGDNDIVAMLSSDDDSLFIFDEPASVLECVRLKTDFGTDIGNSKKLAASRDGFVLYSKKMVVCISKLSGAALGTNYHVRKIEWETEKSYESTYCFDGDRWIRLRHKHHNRRDDASCGHVSHHQLTTVEDTSLLHWEDIPDTSDDGYGYDLCSRGVFAISLPKGATRCHEDCPHCKMAKDTVSSKRTYLHSDDEYDYIYDSSDSDHYYGYDSDDYSD